jgi:hypothetical protein
VCFLPPDTVETNSRPSDDAFRCIGMTPIVLCFTFVVTVVTGRPVSLALDESTARVAPVDRGMTAYVERWKPQDSGREEERSSLHGLLVRQSRQACAENNLRYRACLRACAGSSSCSFPNCCSVTSGSTVSVCYQGCCGAIDLSTNQPAIPMQCDSSGSRATEAAPTTMAAAATTMAAGSSTVGSTLKVNHGVQNTDSQSMSPALIAGIAVGSIAALVLLICIIVFCFRRKRLADFEAQRDGIPSNHDASSAPPGSTPEQAKSASNRVDGDHDRFDAKPTVAGYPDWWIAKPASQSHPTPLDGSSYAPSPFLSRCDTGSSASSDGIIVAPVLEATSSGRNIPIQSAAYDLSYSSISSQTQLLEMQRHQLDPRRPYP